MNSQDLKEHRSRLYGKYISSGSTGLIPTQVGDLSPRLPYLRKIVREYFPEDKHAAILDVGCGYGALLYVAQREGYDNLVGVDTSAEQVAAAQILGISSVNHGDVFSFIEKQASNSYNTLIAFDVLEHFTKPEIIRIIDESHRILKPGGRFIIHVPNGESPFVGRVLFGDFTHEQAFTQRSLTSLLRASNFGETHCYEDRPVPHGIKSIIRWALWVLIRNLLRFYIIVETGEAGRNMIFSQNFLTIAFKN